MGQMPMFVVATLGLGLIAAPVRAQSASTDSFRTSNPTLRASLDRISKGSALWREAAAALAASGRHVVVVTPDQVRIADAPGAGPKDAFDLTILAEAAPVVERDGQVNVVLVAVNLELLEGARWKNGSLISEFEADLDRILVHEIYGHAVPYLLAGDLSGRCPDPIEGERAANACSIRRENLIRSELGLGRRTDYGLDGLALTRRDRH